LTELLQQMEEAEARLAILDFLQSINIHIESERDSDEIIDRLLTKIRRRDQTPGLQQALRFMDEIGRLSGSPADVLRAAEGILGSFGIEYSVLETLRAIVGALEPYQLDWGKINLDLSLSRGLQYYTGTIFEVHHGGLGEERQLCGGGRYDDLIATLGGLKDIPATGFSYGLERLHLALEAEGQAQPNSVVNALVVAISEADYPYAIQTAESLRQKGLRVELDVRHRSVKSNLKYADKHSIPFTILIGSAEREQGEVMLRAMSTRTEYPVKRETIYERIMELNHAH
jgi:histidyl-tRNA synthetase